MLLSAVDRAESSRRELAITDARFAAADPKSFDAYVKQFDRAKNGL